MVWGVMGNDESASLAQDGVGDLPACRGEAHGDQIFGVPPVMFRGEQFRGYQYIALLERRRAEHGWQL